MASPGAVVDPDAALRALAHEGRRRMLHLVWSGERTSSELAATCGYTKPAASQHLKVLRDAALVEVRVAGNRRLYRARHDTVSALARFLDAFWGGRLAALKAAVEQDAISGEAVG